MSKTQVTLLKKYNLAVRGSKGQHLLIDPNIQRKIVETVDPKSGEWILEIGPGLGALTQELLAAGASVIAVEKDKRFCEILEEELGADYKGRLWIKNEDILRTDLRKLLNTRTCPLGQVSKRSRKIKVVSNLPYYITSPVLFWLVANRTWVERAVLMMQREVANRLLAQPGEKDYGRLTLAIRYYAQVQRAFHVSRNCFSPRPDVDSTVIALDFYPPSKLPKGIDRDLVFRLIQVAFGARRKMLLNRFVNDSKIQKSRAELLEILRELKIPETARAEDLLLKDFISLAESLSK